MEEKISIIIPVYNVEKFIRYCLESVINQTYKNLEIIIVDDGTKDNSGAIAEEYAKKDKRIKVFHKQNGGLSSARNYGLNNSTGKYITFLDSDDYIYKDYMKYLYNLLKNNDADVSECEYFRIHEDDIAECKKIIENENVKLTEKIEIYDGITSLKLLYGPNYKDYMRKVVVWNKMYKREIFDDIRFPEGKLHEDEYTTFKVLDKVNKIVSSNIIMHGYIQTKNSIMRSDIKQQRIQDNLGAYEEGANFFMAKKEEYIESIALRRYLENCIELSGKVMKSESDEKENKLEYIQNLYNMYYLKYINMIKENAIIEKENRIIKIIDEAYNNKALVGNYWTQLEELVKMEGC